MERAIEDFVKKVAGKTVWEAFYHSHPDKKRLNHILDNPKDMTSTEIEDIVMVCNDPDVDYYTIVNNFISRKPKRKPVVGFSEEDLELMRLSVSVQIDNLSKVLGFIEQRNSLNDFDRKLIYFYLEQLVKELENNKASREIKERATSIIHKLKSL